MSVSTLEPLTNDKGHPTVRCVLLAQRGDRRALDLVVRGCQAILKHVARHYDEWVRDDLMQEASIGLLRAIKKWRPDGGKQFAGYAYQWAWAFASRARMLKRRRLAHECLSVGLETADTSDNGAGVYEMEAPFRRADLETQLSWARRDDVELLKRRANGETLEEIAAAKGLSRERIRQLEKLARSRVAQRVADMEVA